eukprot:g10722.t1
MDGEDATRAASERVAGSRLSLSRRAGQGHNRTWARVSLGGFARGRRRDKEPKTLGPRSPTRRITLGGTMREEGVGAGGAAFKGRHGIRYEQTHSDSWLEGVKQEASEGDQAATPMPTSSSMGQLAQASTIAEEGGTESQDGGQAAELGDADAHGEEGLTVAADSQHSNNSLLPRQVPVSAQAQLTEIHEDSMFGYGGGAMGQVSPASDFRRGSMSPGVSLDGRARTHSWTAVAAASSPPVLRGPFSRARSRSRSPRHRMSMTMGIIPGGFHQITRKVDHGRFSSGGGSGGIEQTPVLSKDPSLASAGESGAGWNDGGGEGATGDEEGRQEAEAEGQEGEGEVEGGEEKATGPFTDTCLEMARLRLPHMEQGFEEDGFFGIDVRSLIIGREIARGAYGVVHEGKLLRSRPKDEQADDGGENGGQPAVTTGEDESGASDGAGAGAEGEAETETETGTPSTAEMQAEGEGKGEAAKATEEGSADDDAAATAAAAAAAAAAADAALAAEDKTEGVAEGEGKGGAGGEEGERGENVAEGEYASSARSVAVKIQQVPVDEEEQANLLGELAMLRNYKHAHLVEFIGTAMAVERGADTVMVAMELCTNGALREALKLNISWPLKVRIASDMTDGLQYLHQHGIIHRDIKTPNVLIDGSWRAKLCDYNFAIDENSSIKQDFCAGTAEFMSPEVLLSEDYGLPSDVFSLGMIFVEMLTGKEPSPTFPERPPQTFFVVSEEEIEEHLLPDYPSSFSLLQSQCLFAEPGERPTAEDAFHWLQDMVNETGEENITLPQSGPPLPVLTEGAAIAREGNVINASPKGSADHPWIDADAMEQQIESMVESAVERALAERREAREVGRGLVGDGDEVGESAVKLDEMKGEINALRAACEERESRISELEVQALRNTSTLKMLSSALEVAYKMLEAQQAALPQPNPASSLPNEPRPAGDGDGDDQTEASGDRDSFSGGTDYFDAVETRLSQAEPN